MMITFLEIAIAINCLAHTIMDVVDEEEADTIAKFLNLLMEDVKNSDVKLVPYTKEMDAKLENLLSGVEID
jgi:hypothetical protein